MIRLLTTAELSEWLQIPVATLHRWRYEHKGPPASKVGRHLRYREEDVLAWLESNRAC